MLGVLAEAEQMTDVLTLQEAAYSTDTEKSIEIYPVR